MATAARPLADRPPARVGDAVAAVETPALVVDLDAFDRNVARLRERAAAFPSLALRPHFKAVKVPELAARAARALGPQFTGLSTQKVGETEAALSAGASLPAPWTVLLTNEVVCPARLARLASLAAAHPGRVGLAVDSRLGVDAAADAAGAAGARLGVVVEVDAGQARCGVPDAASAAELASHALSKPGLDLWGVQAYHGGIQHVRGVEERRAAAGRVASIAAGAAAAVRGVAGPGADLIVTGGGTGTWELDAAAGALTEVQPGSFVFNDGDYSRNEDGGAWAQALFVLTQVMSASPGRAVVDAGLKAVDVVSGPPVPLGPGPLAYSGAGDEHGILRVDDGSGGAPPARPAPPPGGSDWPVGTLPPLAAKVFLQPSHCDPTVNLYDWIVGGVLFSSAGGDGSGDGEPAPAPRRGAPARPPAQGAASSARPPASSAPRLPPSHKGYALLKKAGWTEGTGLGAREDGPTEPLAVARAVGRAGVGRAAAATAPQPRPPPPAAAGWVPPPPEPSADEQEARRTAAEASAREAAKRASVGLALAREWRDDEGGGAQRHPTALAAASRRLRGSNPLL